MIVSRLLVSTAVLMLASCGGGGGGAPTSGGTPTPSGSAPTPAPSTPAPSPSYPSFASLTGAQSYSSGCVTFAPMFTTGSVPAIDSPGFYQLNSGNVSYNPAGETFTVLGNSFGSADRISGSFGSTSVYTKPDPLVSSATQRFDLVQPSPGVYSRTTSVLVQGQGRGNYCVLGVPTQNTDVPAGPTVTFTTFAVRGRAFVKRPGGMIEYDLAPSTATLVVDMTTGQFTSKLNLVGSNGGSNTALGTHDIVGTLIEASSGMRGGQAGMPVVNPIPGTGGVIVRPISVEGGFFGPRGVEFAYVFSRQEQENIPARDITYSFFGTVAGSR